MRPYGKVLKGNLNQIEQDFAEFSNIKLDLNLLSEQQGSHELNQKQHTISKEVMVSGKGTFNSKKNRTLKFCPTDKEGWWFKRTDISGQNLIKVDYSNASTANFGGVNNITLSNSQNSDAFVRLTEHIIALKTAVGIDNLIIEINSMDPPLFNKGSIDIIETLKKAGRKKQDKKLKYRSVKERVIMGFGNRGFLMLEPPQKNNKTLEIDCAINYPDNIIGKQRIRIPVTAKIFKKGAVARTNTSLKHAALCKTIGKLHPSTSNLGYNSKNVLIFGKKKYYNTPRLIENNKVLEPIWHRAVLDLLAAAALIPDGILIGKLTSYKAGHTQDVEFIKELYNNEMLVRC
ncbi:MAG: UDP-3-O-acyl-N-acetylglucosamine deacetylase [Victivallales bacterium]|nr:UDP-3-O-acyl-N-acetylglucosamine deacetylase [Victivallales bacterium]MCF7889003.1 UDP-3-O-acyl-N-acetylglucosamine deacetylase [Victivallales bacterium]